MSGRSSFSFAVFVCIIVSACASYFAPDYPPPPCGYRDVSCGNGYCCPESHTCNKDGTCTYRGLSWPSDKLDGGHEASTDAATDADADR